jgi:signal transduction histidine kinase
LQHVSWPGGETAALRCRPMADRLSCRYRCRALGRRQRGASGEFVISVSDTGIGISENSLERVFAPFERAGDPATHDVEGTGLGLSIMRGLVALHGGVISLTSELGGGTIVMPATRVDAAELPARII